MAKRGRPKKTTKAPVKTDNRRQLLDKLIGDINRKAGERLVQYASEEQLRGKIPFGIKSIDELSGGGVTRGNFTIVYGGERVGKSTLALILTAQAQASGLVCCYIDMERGFDSQRAEQFGVNLKDLVLIKDCDTAEQAMDIIVTFSRERVVDLAIVDSVQAMSPKGEQYQGKSEAMKSIEDDTMALLARKLGQFFRICAPRIHKGKVGVVLIGQVRTQGIGTFITREGLSGGHSIKHWSVMTLYMRHGQGADAPTKKITVNGKKKTTKTGFDSVIKLEKTKISGSKTEGEEIHIPFYFKTGFAQQ